MSRANRLLVGRTVLFSMFVSLIVSGVQAEAQNEKDPNDPACADSPCPKISVDSAFRNGLEEGVDLVGSRKPAVPVQSQVAPKDRRLFWVLPNYLTVENLDQFDRLSTKTKFQLSAKTMSDPITISFIGAIALIGQAQNSDPSYGQGLKGYGERFGTFYANTAIGTLMTTSIFPTLLHQDPRYFQLGSGTTWHRAKYSMSRIFVTRADRGQGQFNYSEIVGTAVAAGISNTYLPSNQRTLTNTASVWGTNIMLNMMCNVAKEFWPDIRRKFSGQAHPTSR